jgi:hypothetical protein
MPEIRPKFWKNLDTRPNFSIFTPNAAPDPQNAPLARPCYAGLPSNTGSMARCVWGVKKHTPQGTYRDSRGISALTEGYFIYIGKKFKNFAPPAKTVPV